jgi:Ca-activated chloride channel homolog
MKHFRFFLMTLFLPVVFAGEPFSAAQQIEVNVERVNVLFSVKDNKGKLVTNLKQSDFKLFEDDKPQVIERVNIDTDLPLHIALLIDRSGTVQNQLKLEKDAAIEFLNRTLKHGKDKAVVIGFDTAVDDLSNGFTDDIEKLSDPIRKILAGGSTSVFDAVYIASNQYLSKQPSRRLAILISDGDDNNSRKTLEEAMLVAQRSEVSIYSISTNLSVGSSGADRDRGDKNLKKLSEETGGRAFFPKKLEDLETGFQSIGEEVRSQYSLIYSPTNKVRDGRFRKYRVVANNKNFKVTARPGYFAPSPVASR